MEPVNIRINGGTVSSVKCPACHLDVAVSGEPAINPRTEFYQLNCCCGQVIHLIIRK